MKIKLGNKELTIRKWKAKPGKWIKTNTEYTGKNRSYHLNEMASPWKNWQEIWDNLTK